MKSREEYAPGPARGARVDKQGDEWTLVLVRDLRHAPATVWEALTDPAQLREWSPYDSDRNLGSVGPAKLSWAGTPQSSVAEVKRAEAGKLLELDNGGQKTRWELEPHEGGTRLTLWININKGFIAMGAAGWHLAFDVLERLLAGQPIGRIAGMDSMKLPAWQTLMSDYAKLLGAEVPKWNPRPKP